MAATPITVGGVRAELHTIKPSGDDTDGSRNWEDPDVPFAAITAYAIIVGGERIGVVSSKRGTSHRHAGRLITRTYHPTEWVATICGFHRPSRRGDWEPVGARPRSGFERNAGDWYRQRSDAVRCVVDLWQELTGGA